MKKLIIALIIFQLLCFKTYSQSPLTDTMVTGVMNFSWMPDGKSICFSALRRSNNWRDIQGGGIFKIDLKTSQIVQLVKNGYNPSVSPDGKKMAYTKVFGSGFGGNS